MSVQTELFQTLSEEEQALAMSLLFERRFNQPQTPAPAYIDLPSFFREPLPPREYLVDGLLARGHLAMLGGRPKSGKSWLALQLAQAVDGGRPFLGRAAQPGRVLYAPLEDGPNRLYERAKSLGWTARQSKAVFKLLPLNLPNGDPGPGLEQIETAAGDFDLVIIDTLSVLLNGRVSENDNAAMGTIINEVAAIAHNSTCAILLVHHAGKGFNEEDHFTLMRGASAIRAAYDVGMLLVRKPGEREALLRIESRDAEVEGMTIRQTNGNAGWELVGDLSALKFIRSGRKVVEALIELGDWQKVETLADYLKISKQSITAQLHRAENDRLVRRRQLPSDKPGRPTYVWALYDAPDVDLSSFNQPELPTPPSPKRV